MKAANDWTREFINHYDSEIYIPSDFIEAIQQDAYRAGLLRAAQVCRESAQGRGSTKESIVVIEHWHCHHLANAIELEVNKPLP